MADEAELQESVQDSSVEENTEGSQPETQPQDSNETSTEGSGESQAGSNTENAGSSDTGQSETQDSKPDQKPLSRRSAAYRIQQLVTENSQLKKQLGKPAQQEQDEWEPPQEDEPKPDIAAIVNEAVQKALHPVISESTKAADDAEINELFSGDKASERAVYEPQIRELWKLPQYKDVAASDLHAMLVGKNMTTVVQSAVSKAIEDYKTAQKEAKESSASGSSNISNRTGSGGKSVADMSDEEFAQHNEQVKAGRA